MLPHHQPLFTRALQHHQAGEIAQAESLCREIVRDDPNCGAAWNLLGALAYQTGQTEAACAAFARACAATPASAVYRSNHGEVLKELGKLAEAEAEFRQALWLNPNNAEACNNLGDLLRDQGRYAEAETTLLRALQLRPDYAGAHSNLGNVYQDQDRFEEAETCFRRALELQPDFPEAHLNLGTALLELKRFAEAEACLLRAIQLKPDYVEAHNNLAHLLLEIGDFERGWAENEWRLQMKQFQMMGYSQPLWDGSSLAGRTILLVPEGGLGDSIHFIRYAVLLKELGATVLFHCPKRLLSLLRTCAGIDQLIPVESPAPPCDVRTLLMSLPRLLSTTLATIPAAVPYVWPEQALVERWKQRLAGISGFKVGIVWQGNPNVTVDRVRSVPLAQFAPLARVPGVHLFSLQVGHGAEQIQALSAGLPTPPFAVTDLGKQFDPESLADAAAVLKNLNLLVTVDTALAHLAAAMGVPVWVAARFGPEWRWLQDREDSPWYPTLRLFRQQRSGDWDHVFARMTEELSRAM